MDDYIGGSWRSGVQEKATQPYKSKLDLFTASLLASECNELLTLREQAAGSCSPLSGKRWGGGGGAGA